MWEYIILVVLVILLIYCFGRRAENYEVYRIPFTQCDRSYSKFGRQFPLFYEPKTWYWKNQCGEYGYNYII